MVVCSRDRPQLLAAALDAIRGTLETDDELIVVDSASSDARVALVAAESGARVLRAAVPGLGHARNLGWGEARRPVVAFTDDDCAPAPGWTRALASVFEDSAVGIAFGCVLGDGGGESLSVTTSDRPRRVDPGGDVTGLGHGANMACRRQALAAVNGFDEALGAGSRFPAAEDSDLATRLLEAGWSAVFAPDAVVTHQQWRGRVPALRVMYRYGIGAGAAAAKPGPRRTARVRHEVWDEGLRMSARHLRAGYEFGAAACLLRSYGAAVGAARAWRLPVHDGRFDA